VVRVINGDNEKLADLIKKLGKADKQAKSLAAAVAPKIQELNDRVWQRRASPDGEKWKARKHSYPHPILEKTGRTRTSLRSVARGAFVVTRVSTPYAEYHQVGTRTMEARPIFPAKELPRVWLAHVNKIAQEHVLRWLAESNRR
jgi:phage gpG-like protein